MIDTLLPQAGVMQKGVREVRPAADATEARPKGGGERGERRATVVGEFATFDVADHRFDGLRSGAYPGKRSTVSQGRWLARYVRIRALV